MEERNAEYLQTKVLRDLGLEGMFTDEMRANMKIGKPVFNLSRTGIDKSGNEITLELTNFVKKDDFYMLNGPAKLTTKDLETGQNKTGVFRLYNQKGFTANEMLSIMNGAILYKPSRENNQETHKIHFLASQPGPLKRKNDNNRKQEPQKEQEAYTAERIFGTKDPQPIMQGDEQSMKEFHVSSVRFKLSDLAKKFNDLPNINANQQQIEGMMRTVLLGGTVDTKLTLPSTGERVDAKITLSKGAGLNVKDTQGNYLNLKSESLDFTLGPVKPQINNSPNINNSNEPKNTASQTDDLQQNQSQGTNHRKNLNKGKDLMDKNTQQSQRNPRKTRKSA